MNSFKNCGIITIPDQGLKSLIFLLYWFRLTGLLALYMEHYCEKMNSLGCGHQKKTYGNMTAEEAIYAWIKSEFFDAEEVGISFHQCVLRTDEAKH